MVKVAFLDALQLRLEDIHDEIRFGAVHGETYACGQKRIVLLGELLL